MNKAMREQLKDWEKKHKEPQGKPQMRRDEVLTDADMRYLMGTNRGVYRRARGGALRQR